MECPTISFKMYSSILQALAFVINVCLVPVSISIFDTFNIDNSCGRQPLYMPISIISAKGMFVLSHNSATSSSVTAHKILAIRGNDLIVQLWRNSDKTSNIPVSMPEEYSIGDYVDLQVIRHSKTSHSITLIGHTPQKFIPANGTAVAIS